MSKARVMLVDDHVLFREGLRMALEAQGGFEVVGEAGDAVEALQVARKTHPSIVVMDISMEGNGREVARRMLLVLPQTKVIILTTHGSDEYFFRALEAGAVGYVVKGTTSVELVAALRAATGGEVYLHPSMAGYLVANYLGHVGSGEEQEAYARLSDREKEVLALIA